MKINLKNYLQLFTAFLVYSFAGVFAKMASNQKTLIMSLIYLGIEIIVLGIYALIWQNTLKKFPLIIAMSCKGITVILSLLWAALLFGENITKFNIIGAFLIIAGIGVVASDV